MIVSGCSASGTSGAPHAVCLLCALTVVTVLPYFTLSWVITPPRFIVTLAETAGSDICSTLHDAVDIRYSYGSFIMCSGARYGMNILNLKMCTMLYHIVSYSQST